MALLTVTDPSVHVARVSNGYIVSTGNDDVILVEDGLNLSHRIGAAVLNAGGWKDEPIELESDVSDGGIRA